METEADRKTTSRIIFELLRNYDRLIFFHIWFCIAAMQSSHSSFYGCSFILLSSENCSRKVKKMNLIRSFNKWRRYRLTVNELSRLSTHELNDLGICRADIPAIARKACRHGI